ncbi:MAG: type II secretion system protein [Clostridia bacterium]|nr:type II secretion system protein [Clostridia bacterium]
MQKKKGISLIVLVITIIVMIILAAAVIISMSNNGVIDRANNAVNKTNLKEVQDLASLIWAEAYLDEERTDTIENVVKDKLEEQGVTEDKWDIQVSDEGVTVALKNAASGTEEGKLSGEWVFNEQVSIPEDTGIVNTQSINFSSNGSSFTSMNFTEAPTYNVPIISLNYDDTEVGIGVGGIEIEIDVTYSIINFGSTPQEVSEEFYDWFTSNATKVS